MINRVYPCHSSANLGSGTASRSGKKGGKTEPNHNDGSKYTIGWTPQKLMGYIASKRGRKSPTKSQSEL